MLAGVALLLWFAIDCACACGFVLLCSICFVTCVFYLLLFALIVLGIPLDIRSV